MHVLPGGPVGLSLRAFECFHTHTKGKEPKYLKERDKKKKMKKKNSRGKWGKQQNKEN
jgi:hypothetical protein